jgi:diaminohydroxyphosphoribosylaminopyrimidine deaminase/5-amino-6-(5-phosphoribosylamino)uracil reductase
MTDIYFMRRALELSLKGDPSPNPYVGAVLVRDGKIISEGYHKRAGMPHAEAEALKGVDARGATLYVTLEPCSRHGRTPPCTNAIIEAGVAEVVYGIDDPTEKVNGRKELEAAGLKVSSGVLAGECGRVNEAFLKHAQTGRPFVVLKAAVTLDAQTATKTGASKWITSGGSRRIVHELRNRYDAVLVGVNTVLADDPLLTCRIEGGRNPLRIILDSELRTPAEAKVLKDDNVLIATTQRYDKGKLKKLSGKAEVVVLGEVVVDLGALLDEVGGRGVTSILVEGGGTVNYAFAKAHLADKYVFFIAPKLMLGANTPAFNGEGIITLDEVVGLEFDAVEMVGPDLLVTAYPII